MNTTRKRHNKTYNKKGSKTIKCSRKQNKGQNKQTRKTYKGRQHTNGQSQRELINRLFLVSKLHFDNLRNEMRKNNDKEISTTINDNFQLGRIEVGTNTEVQIFFFCFQFDFTFRSNNFAEKEH